MSDTDDMRFYSDRQPWIDFILRDSPYFDTLRDMGLTMKAAGKSKAEIDAKIDRVFRTLRDGR